jgi:hypothetical protein
VQILDPGDSHVLLPPTGWLPTLGGLCAQLTGTAPLLASTFGARIELR